MYRGLEGATDYSRGVIAQECTTSCFQYPGKWFQVSFYADLFSSCMQCIVHLEKLESVSLSDRSRKWGMLIAQLAKKARLLRENDSEPWIGWYILPSSPGCNWAPGLTDIVPRLTLNCSIQAPRLTFSDSCSFSPEYCRYDSAMLVCLFRKYNNCKDALIHSKK